VWSLSKGVRGHSPTECHRTIRAHIRFHLDGGPQGWNPHFSGHTYCPEAILKASSSNGELTSPQCGGRVSSAPAKLRTALASNRATQATFASHANALLRIRASVGNWPDRGASPRATFASDSMGVGYLTPSDRSRRVRRLHG